VYEKLIPKRKLVVNYIRRQVFACIFSDCTENLYFTR